MQLFDHLGYDMIFAHSELHNENHVVRSSAIRASLRFERIHNLDSPLRDLSRIFREVGKENGRKSR